MGMWGVSGAETDCGKSHPTGLWCEKVGVNFQVGGKCQWHRLLFFRMIFFLSFFMAITWGLHVNTLPFLASHDDIWTAASLKCGFWSKEPLMKLIFSSGLVVLQKQKRHVPHPSPFHPLHLGGGHCYSVGVVIPTVLFLYYINNRCFPCLRMLVWSMTSFLIQIIWFGAQL